MVSAHSLLRRNVAEHVTLLLIASSHVSWKCFTLLSYKLLEFFSTLIRRLRTDAGTKAPISRAAGEHGELRHKQGYTVAMMVDESRLLEVSIFTTLYNNVTQLEFSALLPGVVTIADEVDSQLKE